MTELKTWAGRSKFSYSGSVKEGTEIIYGKGFKVKVSSEQYHNLLQHFKNKIVNIGTSRDNEPPDSIGEWLKQNVTKAAIACYIGAILVNEGYASKFEGTFIKFYEGN